MTDRFSYWKRHNPLYPVYEAEFLKWINQRTDLIEGNAVLDAGCGMARNSVFCAKHGAASVCGVEINKQVIPAARKNSEQYENITILQSAIEDIDLDQFAESFDTVICIGVLHHLPNADIALKRLHSCLKEGGHFIAMVYAYEGNENFLKLLRPARIISKRIPLPLLEVLAIPVSLVYRAILPFLKGEYFELHRQSPFSALHYNIVDQLCPDIAHYWTRQEVVDLFRPHFAIQNIVHTNGRTWTVVAEKSESVVCNAPNENIESTNICSE